MKLIIYQVLNRLWGKGKFSDWDSEVFAYLKSFGLDCLWYTGIPRHASGKSFVKGDPGSPYSIRDWKDVNPYLADNPEARMEEFRSLVERTHSAGLRLIIDYIPNHVARDYSGPINHFDYCDADWSDTYKNDWASPQTREAMIDILRFWASMGVDGFRCDMVELVPSDALGLVIKEVKKDYPSLIFVAEAYGKENYRKYLEDVGFDLLYDKSGMYDSLRNISCHGHSAKELTWNWQWLSDMQGRMLNFLENHDEQRIASPEFLGSAQKSYAALAFSLLYNDASFMLYFGQEIGLNAEEGAGGRTSIFEWRRPKGIERLVNYIHGESSLTEQELSVLNRYREFFAYAILPVFRTGKVWDLCYCNYNSDGFDPDRHFVFVRYDKSEAYLVFCNFSSSEARVRICLADELLDVLNSVSNNEIELNVEPFDAQLRKIAKLSQT